jgi:hypothetical protein
MAAANHRKMTKGKFEMALCGKYSKVESTIYYEQEPMVVDGVAEYGAPIKLTLYYEVMPEPDEWGIVTRHCGTWTKGKCWEFLTKGE